MGKTTTNLASKDLVLVFAMARAGLGHLRVTDALYHGLPKEAQGLLLGAQDETIIWLHRLSSSSPAGRAVQEFFQTGWAEDIFTATYRNSLRKNTDQLYKQMVTILEQRVELPKTLLMVSTHFGLSHQMAVIKDKLAKERGIRVVLVNVVTDDSPQHIWAIGGADLIFVPSNRTKNSLEKYHARQRGLAKAQYVVAPYAVSPWLGKHYSAEKFKERVAQGQPGSKHKIQVAIPISGAAVQLKYFEEMVNGFSQKSQRFKFHIVSRQSKHTDKFLKKMQVRKDTELLVSDKDREVVDLYEQLYHKERILLEVTKPSEQAFKALVPPKCVGGSIILFSHPVGRQEYDNIAFLRRHDLMPDKDLQHRMWRAAYRQEKLSGTMAREVAREIHGWRGVRLPRTPEETVTYVMWSLEQGLFDKMINFRGYQDHPELSPYGVRIFWERVSEYLAKS